MEVARMFKQRGQFIDTDPSPYMQVSGIYPPNNCMIQINQNGHLLGMKLMQSLQEENTKIDGKP